MPPLPVPLDSLIAYVQSLHPDGGPLDRLADAVGAAAQLDEQSDALIGHFVDRARSSGATWSQIGSAMGVSKQAAQKRFVVREDDDASDVRTFSRFTPRARLALAAAGSLADQDGAGAVEASHLAAGSVADPDGLAARAIRRLEVTEEQFCEAVGAGPATGDGDPEPAALRRLELAPSCRDALKEALKAALRLGHNYIGTEHLLLGIAAGGPVAGSLEAAGLKASLIESAIAIDLAEAQLRRRRGSG